LDCIAVLEALSALVQLPVALYVESNDNIQYWKVCAPTVKLDMGRAP
jgi:hypothetical protein